MAANHHGGSRAAASPASSAFSVRNNEAASLRQADVRGAVVLIPADWRSLRARMFARRQRTLASGFAQQLSSLWRAS